MCDGLLLPGGRYIKEVNFKVIDYFYQRKKPILGICMGMQTLAMYSVNIENKERKRIIKPIDTGVDHWPIEVIRKKDLIFCIGPAGSGKTYLAITSALSYLTEKRIERIILTKPVVEAGEKLGFLPGTFLEKVDPHFRPLYDALYDLVEVEKINRYIENDS